MKSIYVILFLLFFGCAGTPKTRSIPVQQTPPRASSGSLSKNIEELDAVMSKSLLRIDKIISELGAK
jgi:hypothetical protein